MIKNKEIWITGFALFSLFFGAGNLILPPFLGTHAGQQWWLVFLGFMITAVLIPILGILAHAKVQGTMFDLAKKVSPWFSSLYCFLMYVIAITIPAPRTASVAHEMAIKPIFGTSSLLTSSLYFLLIFIFVINRSKIISLIGKFLTPVIILILLAIIALASTRFLHEMNLNTYEVPFVSGLLEGYQTFDAIGGVVVGAVVIVSLKLQGYTSYKRTKELVTKAGCIAGFGLLFIYGGLIFSGAVFSDVFPENASRTDILTRLSSQTLGTIGTSFLSILVSLACFTTAVGIVTGASDYVKGIFKNSQKAYVLTSLISCVLGILIGHFEVRFIIQAAIPALMFIYPITIALILLNVVPKRLSSSVVFKGVVLVTFLFSIPDFLNSLQVGGFLKPIIRWIPLASQSLGWVLPALITFLVFNLHNLIRNSEPNESSPS